MWSTWEIATFKQHSRGSTHVQHCLYLFTPTNQHSNRREKQEVVSIRKQASVPVDCCGSLISQLDPPHPKERCIWIVQNTHRRTMTIHGSRHAWSHYHCRAMSLCILSHRHPIVQFVVVVSSLLCVIVLVRTIVFVVVVCRLSIYGYAGEKK